MSAFVRSCPLPDRTIADKSGQERGTKYFAGAGKAAPAKAKAKAKKAGNRKAGRRGKKRAKRA